MKKKAIFIAATGQHVGKTTTCLGIYSGLMKRYDSVGFIKPVGQQHLEIGAQKKLVDKDAVLFKEHFDLKIPYEDMSPVLCPSGFTRDCIDGKIPAKSLEDKILNAFDRIQSTHEYVLVEGTGHMGVGTIMNVNNARVAQLLDLDVIIVAPGGIGSTFDQLVLNIGMCREYDLTIRGIILNKVQEEKIDMVSEYIQKAIKRWDIPLLGCIPFSSYLSSPSMEDFENLFQAQMLSGEAHRYRHFEHARLAATTDEQNYEEMILPRQLVITHSDREDIIKATLDKHRTYHEANPDKDLGGGMILAGKTPPNKEIIEEATRLALPIIYAPMSSYKAMKKLVSFVGKIRNEDERKVEKAINLVENHVDFDGLLKC
ncbi:Uncharacterized protein SCG7109_AG_00280 [Chlamydiales bacterium SCGC AG-110-M15]|nr:Uncharacterized protein SCG7109_AG_00280 [Chlamydiales bacterium SCGC AG-110-M15]